MGYYNSPPPKKKSFGGHFASGFSGVLAGALLVGVILPGFTDNEPGVNVPETVETANNVEGVSQVVSTDITQVVEEVSGAVVGVSNMQETQQNPFMASGSSEAGAGSGVIYKKEGDFAYIVTNQHVVDGAEAVKVTMADGTELDAEPVGGDVWTDLAVLKVSGDEIETVAEFGDSTVLKAGEPVIAIGNPLGLQFSGSVTTGVISGTERTIPIDINQDGKEDWQAEVLQTDAAINPGNSGGALINSQGQVIGINSMKVAQAAVEGIGLAIPINSVIPIVEDLETKGVVERPAMGVVIMDLADVPQQYRSSELKLPEEVTGGVVVESVSGNSGAEQAGMEPYDVIVEIDGKEVNSALELRQYLYNETETGDTLKLLVYRNGGLQEIELTLSDKM
ncbi:MAG TPA: trypsin-like peptidase domain-containing protein [Planococcus sp. (in: firmicutes)]|nr:trypsin-like peptidase domain-containing protein [Planococcus sp. (in: firmicutes)]